MHVVMDIDTFDVDAVLVCERKVHRNTQVCLFLLVELSPYVFRLNRNTASRVISLFEMPIKKIINFMKLVCGL